MSFLDRFKIFRGAKTNSTTPSRKELTGEVAAFSQSDMWGLTNPAKGITPAKLESILNDADDGDIGELVDLAYDIEEREGHLAGLLQTRKQALLGLDWQISASNSDDAKAQEIAEAASEMLLGIDNLDEGLLDLLDGIMKPLAVCEIMWDVSTGQAMPTTLNWVHQRKFRYMMGQRRGQDRIGALHMLASATDIYGAEIPRSKLVIHQPRSRSGWQCRAGLIRVLSWLYLFKVYAQKDWSIFTELYGQPLRVGKVDTDATDEDVAAFKRALVSMGSDAAAIISKTHELQLLERGSSSGDGVYAPFLSYLDGTISKAVLGHSAAADSTAGKLGNEQSAVDIRSDILAADAYALATTLRRDLLTPWVRLNFGPTAPIPVWEFDLPDDTNVAAKLDEARKVWEMGAPISASYLYEVAKIPAPQKGDEVVVKPEPSAGFGFSRTKMAAAETAPDTEISEDDEIESLTKAGIKASKKWYGAVGQQLAKLVDESEDFSELQAKADNFDADTSDLAEILSDCIFTAHLDGMATTWDEAQEEDAVEASMRPMVVTAALEPLKPEKAIREFAQRIPAPYTEYRILLNAARNKAFSLAGLEVVELVARVQGIVQKAMTEGLSFADFKKDFKILYEAAGVSTKSDFHIETVFRNANQTSYNAARIKTQKQPAVMALRPFWRFDGIQDDRQTAVCSEMSGKVYRADDPIWDTVYPPNHHNCRSKVSTLSQRQVDKRGLQVENNPPEASPADGWSVTPSIE